MSEFTGGAGQLGFGRGYWPLDPKWAWMRKWLFASYDFTEGSGAPMPKAGIAKEIYGPAIPRIANRVPTWGFTPVNSAGLYTNRNQRAGNFGVLMDNGTSTTTGIQYGYEWEEGITTALSPYFRVPNSNNGTRDNCSFFVCTLNSAVNGNTFKTIFNQIATGGSIQQHTLRWRAPDKFHLTIGVNPNPAIDATISGLTDARHVIVLNSKAPNAPTPFVDEVIQLWVDGVLVGSVTSSALSYLGNGIYNLCSNSKPANSGGCHMELFGMMGASMSDAQVMEFSNDPFGHLRPDPLYVQLAPFEQGLAELTATAIIAAVGTDLNRGLAELTATAIIAAVGTDLNRGLAELTATAIIDAVGTDLHPPGRVEAFADAVTQILARSSAPHNVRSRATWLPRRRRPV